MSSEAFALVVQRHDLPEGLYVPVVQAVSVLQDGEGFSDVTAYVMPMALTLAVRQGDRDLVRVGLAPEVAGARLDLLRFPLDEDDEPDWSVPPVRHPVQVIG